MNQNDPTCKSFKRAKPPKFDPATLPPPLARLLKGKEVFPGLTATDLREMSKFSELPNLAGLAAHTLKRNAEGGMRNAEFLSTSSTFPSEISSALDWELSRVPTLLIRGALNGAGEGPFRVAVFVPQAHAWLAQALHRMLWPVAEEPDFRPEYSLLIWPAPLHGRGGEVVTESFAGHWPGDGFGVVIGYDDPLLLASMLAGAVGHEPIAECEVRIANCGDDQKNMWANPLIPASMLARTEAGRRAALSIGSLPLGVEVDAEGRFPIFEASAGEIPNPNGGWVIVPRSQ